MQQEILAREAEKENKTLFKEWYPIAKIKVAYTYEYAEKNHIAWITSSHTSTAHQDEIEHKEKNTEMKETRYLH